jgi:dihydrodipicolinate synthase/N-acetylneuraminate lyase
VPCERAVQTAPIPTPLVAFPPGRGKYGNLTRFTATLVKRRTGSLRLPFGIAASRMGDVMRREAFALKDLQGVFAVPPLPRRADARRTLDLAQCHAVVRHISNGGITRLIYGGNAFLYHITLAEYEGLLDWLASLPDDLWCIPSAGPSYGRAMDQAPLLRRHRFPCVMMLPCHDPRDAAGLELGIREFAEAAATPVIVYVKDESDFGADHPAGWQAIGRLVDAGVCCAIKYAVVRSNPAEDLYLQGLLRHVDRARVISGMGERPAVRHLKEWKLPGFTTGSGCLAPHLSLQIFEHCRRGEWDAAERLRSLFLPLEDLRDAWGPARVLHAAVAAAGIAQTGPLPPYQSAPSAAQVEKLTPVARALAAKEKLFAVA